MLIKINPMYGEGVVEVTGQELEVLHRIIAKSKKVASNTYDPPTIVTESAALEIDIELVRPNIKIMTKAEFIKREEDGAA